MKYFFAFSLNVLCAMHAQDSSNPLTSSHEEGLSNKQPFHQFVSALHLLEPGLESSERDSLPCSTFFPAIHSSNLERQISQNSQFADDELEEGSDKESEEYIRVRSAQENTNRLLMTLRREINFLRAELQLLNQRLSTRRQPLKETPSYRRRKAPRSSPGSTISSDE